jgi:nucleoside-diphosphate-sugar epimerase
MIQLVEALSAVVGRPLKTVRCPLPKDDPVRRRPDTTRARDRLGWQPQTDLRTGLTRTVEFFKEILEA